MRDRIDYVLGDDAGITDLLTSSEVMPFLEGIMNAGVFGTRVCDAEGEVLWEVGCLDQGERYVARLFLEGEPIGSVLCTGCDDSIRVVGEIIACTLNVLLLGSLKRKLTTEVHTQAINQSYEEIVESEQRYRELAASLEVRVEERTRELQQAYSRILQQEKLVSVGQLAAGIAHEINNPLGFILSNFSTLERYVDRFREMLLFCREEITAGGPVGFREEFEQRWNRQKLSLLLDDTVELIQQSREGGARVKKIVSDLKGFSHIDNSSRELIDLNVELERTLNVMAHEIPADARIVRDFRASPKFPGNPALFCQAFYNLIRNACQCRSRGLVLTLTTDIADDMISLVFADNGPGIPEAMQARIFEPFFTTHDVGAGMGLGLALVYDTVCDADGTITVDSQVGVGSRFIIKLPCRSETDG